MNQVGAYEAKTQLPKLLAKVSKGEKIVITKYGVPVAILSPYNDRSKNLYASSETIEELKQFRRDKKLQGLDLKTLIDLGRA